MLDAGITPDMLKTKYAGVFGKRGDEPLNNYLDVRGNNIYL